MPYTMFFPGFRDIAEQETRSIMVPPGNQWSLPAAQYSFLEMFCDEKGCDCRRVMFSVVSSIGLRFEAVIVYGWESREFYAKWMGDDDPLSIDNLLGPVLNISSPQSDIAPAILALAKDLLLTDVAYIERVKRHYKMFRSRIDEVKPAPRKNNKKSKRKK